MGFGQLYKCVLDRRNLSRKYGRNRHLASVVAEGAAINDSGSIHLWVVPQANYGLLNPFADVLSENDWRSIKACALEPRRTQAIAARVLLRFTLSALTGSSIRPAAWEFGKSLQGKPFVSRGPAISFSLSYSHNVIALAVSEAGAVAVDVEVQARPVALAKMDAYLSPPERMLISSQPEAERQSAFLRIWTLKEALVKLTGQGLSEDLSGVDVCQCVLGTSNRLALGSVQAISHSIALDTLEGDGARGWLSLAATAGEDFSQTTHLAAADAPPQ